MDNTNVNQSSNRPSRKGVLNPMSGRHHNDSTRQLMRQKALQRNQEYKKWKDSQHHITMDEFLSNNPTVEEYIKTLVKEQIDKFIWTECKQNKPKQLPLNIWL